MGLSNHPMRGNLAELIVDLTKVIVETLPEEIVQN